jgi:hypothetical protein
LAIAVVADLRHPIAAVEQTSAAPNRDESN